MWEGEKKSTMFSLNSISVFNSFLYVQLWSQPPFIEWRLYDRCYPKPFIRTVSWVGFFFFTFTFTWKWGKSNARTGTTQLLDGGGRTGPPAFLTLCVLTRCIHIFVSCLLHSVSVQEHFPISVRTIVGVILMAVWYTTTWCNQNILNIILKCWAFRSCPFTINFINTAVINIGKILSEFQFYRILRLDSQKYHYLVERCEHFKVAG